MARYTSVSSHWKRTSSSWNGSWVLELGAIGFSVASFLGLCIVLSVGNGKTVWNGVTLNAYVSILATASKLAALFALSSAIGQAKWTVFWHKSGSLLDFEAIDPASRGALGCAQLLFHTRNVALLGALASILAFAFDPFAQQLVQYEAVTEFDNNATAKLPFTRRYDGGNLFPIYMNSGGTVTGQNILKPNPDYAMQAAVLSGIIQPEEMVSQQLTVSCPSGDFIAGNIIIPRQPICGTSRYRCYEHGKLDNFHAAQQSVTGQHRRPTPQLMMTAHGTAIPGETCRMQDLDTLIWSMSMMRAKSSSQDVASDWPNIAIESKECALYYCVNQYQTFMTGNRIQGNITEMVAAKRQTESWQPQSFQGINQSQTEQFLQSPSWRDPGGDTWYKINRTDLSIGNGYNVSNDAVKSLSSLFWSDFWANTSLAPNITGYYIPGANGPDFAPDVMQVLYDEPDLESRFAILAQSMSNAMRMRSEDASFENGSVGQPITKYRIEWPWISLPVVVVIASLIQLLMIMKASKSLPLWKSSILASLSRGPYVKDVFHGAETVAAMRTAAGRDKVFLFEEDLPTSKARAEESLLSISSPSLSSWTNDSEQSPLTPYRSRFDSTRTHRRNISESSTATLVNNAEDSPYSPAIAHFKDIAGHRRGLSDLSSSASAHETATLLEGSGLGLSSTSPRQ